MKDGPLSRRTKSFALQVIHFVGTLPSNRTVDILCKQLLRSATSVGANYRAGCRARSKADFINKLCIVEEEADECLYWLDLLMQSGLSRSALTSALSKEANEIVAMVVVSIKSTRATSRHVTPNSALRTPNSV